MSYRIFERCSLRNDKHAPEGVTENVNAGESPLDYEADSADDLLVDDCEDEFVIIGRKRNVGGSENFVNESKKSQKYPQKT